MKKFISILFIAFLFGCLQATKPDAPIIETHIIDGLVDVEGETYLSLIEFCGVNLETIESWQMIEEIYTDSDKDSIGLIPDHPHIYREFIHPQEPWTRYAIIYYKGDGWERAERIAGLQCYPQYGCNVLIMWDRYLNTDKWYIFSREKFLEQHKISDSERFKKDGNT